MRKVISILALLLFIPTLYATTYYVDYNGSDANSGSSSSPKRTLNAAINLAQDNDYIQASFSPANAITSSLVNSKIITVNAYTYPKSNALIIATNCILSGLIFTNDVSELFYISNYGIISNINLKPAWMSYGYIANYGSIVNSDLRLSSVVTNYGQMMFVHNNGGIINYGYIANSTNEGSCYTEEPEHREISLFNYGNIINSTIMQGAGYAILNYGTITHCNIVSNSNIAYFKGIYNYASGILSNCLISYNVLYGGDNDCHICNSNGLVIDCVISGNSGDVDYAIKNSSSGSIIGCTIIANASSGIDNEGLVDRCIIAQNDDSGVDNIGIIRNCLIYGNCLGLNNFSQLRNSNSEWNPISGQAYNCTIVDNYGYSPYNCGVGAMNSGGLYNSIIRYSYLGSGPSNSRLSNVVDSTSYSLSEGYYSLSSVISYCCTTYPITNDGLWGLAYPASVQFDHIFTFDPLLVNIGYWWQSSAPPWYLWYFTYGNNYELRGDSPGINAGINQAWMSGALDLAGNPRIVGGTVDIGAYEYQHVVPAPSYISATDGTCSDKIHVTWAAVPDATVYKLLCNTSSDIIMATTIATTGNTYYDDSNVNQGVIYYYWVKACYSEYISSACGPDTGYLYSVGNIQFSVSSASINEIDGNLSLSVLRTNGWSGAASVYYATRNGTASAGADYTATSGTLTWADGNSDSKTITVPIINRSGTQGARSFTVALDSASGASQGSPDSVVVTITGTVPSAPEGVSASDGTHTDKVRVTWSMVNLAMRYEVWRHTSNNSDAASKLSDQDLTETTYDDTSATPGVAYYYWVKAVNNAGVSSFSSGDSGYCGQPPEPEPIPPTPIIKANGARGIVIVNYPDTVSVTVEMNSGDYTDVAVDWWAVGYSFSEGVWYYFNSNGQWTSFNGYLNMCHPACQVPLFNLPPTSILNQSGLSRGAYDLWFAVDYPMDGVLDTNGSIVFDKVTVVVR